MALGERWEALLNPGKATRFFADRNASHFEAAATAYSPANAWCLAEISRLIYKQGADEVPGFQGSTRRQILNQAGFEEVQFIADPLAQCAIVKPLAPAASSFVVLVFRGSHELRSWLINLQSLPVKWPSHPGLVHKGFKKALERVAKAIDSGLKNLAGPVFYTGHSLGAALATLAAARTPPQAVYAFGSPRVGSQKFLESLQTKVYRVVNSRDVVATLPPALFGYSHCGELRYITREGKSLVNPTDDQTDAHRFFDPKLLQALAAPHLLVDPPEELDDHAPLNYVSRLRAAFP